MLRHYVSFYLVQYNYEPNRLLKTVVSNKRASDDGVISEYAYLYDSLGRRTSRSQSGLSQVFDTVDLFTYNDRSEVVAWKRHQGLDPLNPGTEVPYFSISYSYDPIGNRISSSLGDPMNDSTISYAFSTNVLNQYQQISRDGSVVDPAYDADGNLLSDDTWQYTWNGENRLIAMEPVSPVLDDKCLEFAYDYQGRRYQKTVETFNDITGSWEAEKTTVFVYDGWNLIAEYELLTSNFSRLGPRPQRNNAGRWRCRRPAKGCVERSFIFPYL